MVRVEHKTVFQIRRLECSLLYTKGCERRKLSVCSVGWMQQKRRKMLTQSSLSSCCNSTVFASNWKVRDYMGSGLQRNHVSKRRQSSVWPPSCPPSPMGFACKRHFHCAKGTLSFTAASAILLVLTFRQNRNSGKTATPKELLCLASCLFCCWNTVVKSCEGQKNLMILQFLGDETPLCTELRTGIKFTSNSG